VSDSSPQQPEPRAAAPAAPAAPLSSTDDKQWASFAHFGGVLGFLPALLIFLLLGERGRLTRQESKEALNWQITFSIGVIALNIALWVVSAVVVAVAGGNPLAGLFITLIGLLPFLLWAVNAVFSILGGVRVNAGGSYRYPFSIRLIK
jgi:uncharacterized Tic20 family protein